jgi:hypothetical protein
MRNSLRTALAIIMLFSAVGCTEQVDLEDYLKSEPSETLVVEGLITNELKPHAIKLTRSGKALPDDPYQPVSGAQVTISDGTVVFDLTEDTDAPVIYLTDSIRGEVNQTYTLTVKINEEVYKASDTMIPVLQFGRPEGIRLAGTQLPRGYIQSPLIIFGSNAPAMVQTRIDNPQPNDKYTHLDYYAFPGVDPDNILPKSVEATLSYTEGTKLTQLKYSLSPEHYQFLRALLLETEYKGGVFGSVRSNVPTNVSNGGFGFFGACELLTRTGTIGKDGQLH